MTEASDSKHLPVNPVDHVSLNQADQLNHLFDSKNPNDVIRFYDNFQGVEDLVKWMQNRPCSDCTLHEVEGDKEVIVVIPTKDIDSEYARRCRDEIFKGFHIVYVVGRSSHNAYFKLTKNSNVAIKKALSYSPRWIVWSNDDMYRIDGPEVLKRELSKISSGRVGAVFTGPADYHSVVFQFASTSSVRRLLLSLSRKGRETMARERKFQVERFAIPGTGLFSKAFYNASFRFRQTCTFGIFSSDYLKAKNGRLFDETYVNACEDSDISIEIAAAESVGELKTATISYQIGDVVGGSLGVDQSRSLRNLAGEAYLNHKIRNGMLKAPESNS